MAWPVRGKVLAEESLGQGQWRTLYTWLLGFCYHRQDLLVAEVAPGAA
jgi:hypothetical protein